MLLTGWCPRRCTGAQTQVREDLLDHRPAPLNQVVVEPAQLSSRLLKFAEMNCRIQLSKIEAARVRAPVALAALVGCGFVGHW